MTEAKKIKLYDYRITAIQPNGDWDIISVKAPRLQVAKDTVKEAFPSVKIGSSWKVN